MVKRNLQIFLLRRFNFRTGRLSFYRTVLLVSVYSVLVSVYSVRYTKTLYTLYTKSKTGFYRDVGVDTHIIRRVRYRAWHSPFGRRQAKKCGNLLEMGPKNKNKSQMGPVPSIRKSLEWDRSQAKEKVMNGTGPKYRKKSWMGPVSTIWRSHQWGWSQS